MEMTDLIDEFGSHWPVTKKGTVNIFRYTSPKNLANVLWGCDYYRRNEQWALECTKTFRLMPEMPVPVSASQMAKKWGCSHTWAKRLIKSDWDWISITTKKFVHNSHMQPFTQIHKACMDAKNPLSCFAAVNLLRTYDHLPYEKELVEYIGWSAFNILRKNGILIPLRGLITRKRMYYVSGAWLKSRWDENNNLGIIAPEENK